ncbi:hypothetical protein BTO32_15305 [Marinobacter lutaoensis]|uniref:Nucleotidyltransferase n=1 Tax=Marinobacter lutaoensis TaxID=135739 RepID=A0A1V2DPM1_9GAMM|nr:nucleotidyl transferase AbiEii/AbiGii toxin family protein [Marinobacter lutaoensis]ONF42572.1 hypothetical protein BTO32_15305 [Marinobacter lutaoensis]
MKIDTADFNALVDRAMQDDSLQHMRPVIEKELIHYDLLYALDREGLLDDLVFQGGTSLRLCYGANRFSEDLDFAGGADFSARQLTEMKQCVEDYLSARYGLEVSVKEPSSLRKELEYAELKIDKWQIKIVTAPGRPDLPSQKIKLEVANIPAHTKTARPLMRNYDFLPDGYEDLLIMVETPSEIMADKLISLPATERYVRNRDIWDLAWLSNQRGCELDADLVERKIMDYRIDDYPGKLDAMISRLPEIIAGKPFHDEMGRFLPANVHQRTLAQPKFHSYLVSRVTDLLTEVEDHLFPGDSQEPAFRM